jgi:hypothetical protein
MLWKGFSTQEIVKIAAVKIQQNFDAVGDEKLRFIYYRYGPMEIFH